MLEFPRILFLILMQACSIGPSQVLDVLDFLACFLSCLYHVLNLSYGSDNGKPKFQGFYNNFVTELSTGCAPFVTKLLSNNPVQCQGGMIGSWYVEIK